MITVSHLLTILLGTSCTKHVSSFLLAGSRPCCGKPHSSSSNLLLSLPYAENDDSEARSQFGTKDYWDAMYQGYGDFDKDEYEWYFGWSEIKPFFQQHVPIPDAGDTTKTRHKLLIPGMGNDPLLLDLVGAGYRDITAFDYSEGAVERQTELLSYDSNAEDAVALLCRDARALDEDWTNAFDAILEKGCLDALYLSDESDGNVVKSAEELHRVLKPGGIFMSVSGVVPAELRREIFSTEKYEWLRDGTDDLKAGCFVWKKR
uniref:Methyltransferase domain-containing protein n=1 Tax=Minutocellus polymorphus TaxID=265543 RepID=A0A7S0FHE1_9STRA|mmetsp:Transcript_10869/g.18089  ORF Transcript_10869/g.18089 Transcript_10869/m.18089 type:complete len:261 (+) Transcript_10869:105-887(+)